MRGMLPVRALIPITAIPHCALSQSYPNIQSPDIRRVARQTLRNQLFGKVKDPAVSDERDSQAVTKWIVLICALSGGVAP